MEPNGADRARHPVRRRLGRRELRAAQLPPARGASSSSCSRRIEPAVVAAPHWLDAKSDRDRAFPDAPDAPAVLLFTSGTSAEPKAAVLEHDQLLAYVFNTLEFASAGEDEAAIVVVPPFHIAGVAAVLSNTYVGRRIVPVPGVRFSAEEWLVTARDEQVTHAMLVPTMLGQDRRGHGGRPESLRVPEPADALVRRRPHARLDPRTGAAPLPRGRLRQRLRPHRDQQHGRASSAPTTTASRSTATSRCSRPASSSVGQPLPGIEIRIVDDVGRRPWAPTSPARSRSAATR